MSSVEASVSYTGGGSVCLVRYTCGGSGIALNSSLIVLNHGYQGVYALLAECKTYYIKSKVSVTGQP